VSTAIALSGVAGAFRGVAMDETGVTVGAPEFAADVRIEGPPSHAGGGRRIEDGGDIALDEARAAGTLIQDAERPKLLTRRVPASGAETCRTRPWRPAHRTPEMPVLIFH